MNGADLIKQERIRQISVEGWTHENDEQWVHGELIHAAASYLLNSLKLAYLWLWPWDESWFKPSSDETIRDLVKAGALIASEIDRRQRSKTAVSHE